MSLVRYGLPLYCPIRMDQEAPNHTSIHNIQVVFNDCLRLLTNNKREDHAKIDDMLNQLGWLSINQLSAETRLIEAWKIAHNQDYCLNDTVKKKKKNVYPTRSNNQVLFDTGNECSKSKNSFAGPTAKIWNKAPSEVKTASNLSQAKNAIRCFVKTLPT